MKKPYVIGFAAKKSSRKSVTIWMLSEFFENCAIIDADTRKSDLMSMAAIRAKKTKLDKYPVIVEKATNAESVNRLIKKHADKDYIFVDTRGALDEPQHMRELYSCCDLLILPVGVDIERFSFKEMLKFVHGKHNYRVLIHSDVGNALKQERQELRSKLEANSAIKVLKQSFPDAPNIKRAALQGTRMGEGFGIRRGLQEYHYKRLADEIKEEIKKDKRK